MKSETKNSTIEAKNAEDLIVWLMENPFILDRVCRSDFVLTSEELFETLEILQKGKHPELIMLLLWRSQTEVFVEKALENFKSQCVISQIREKGVSWMLDEITKSIKEELRK